MKASFYIMLNLLLLMSLCAQFALQRCSSRQTRAQITINCPLVGGSRNQIWQFSELPNGWATRGRSIIVPKNNLQNGNIYGVQVSVLEGDTGAVDTDKVLFFVFQNNRLSNVGQLDSSDVLGGFTSQSSTSVQPTNIAGSASFSSGSTFNPGFVTGSSASNVGGFVNNVAGAQSSLGGSGGLFGGLLGGGGNGGGLLGGLLGGGGGGGGSGGLFGGLLGGGGSGSGGLGGILQPIVSFYSNLFGGLLGGGGGGQGGGGLLNGWAGLFGGGKSRLLQTLRNDSINRQGLIGLINNPMLNVISGMSGIGGGGNLEQLAPKLLQMRENLVTDLLNPLINQPINTTPKNLRYDDDIFSQAFNTANEGILRNRIPTREQLQVILDSRNIDRIQQIINNLCLNGDLDCEAVAPALQQILSQLRNYANLYQFGNTNKQSSLNTFRDQLNILKSQRKGKSKESQKSLRQALTKATSRRNVILRKQTNAQRQIARLQQQILALRRNRQGRVPASVQRTIDNLNSQIERNAQVLRQSLPELSRLSLQARNLNLRLSSLRVGVRRNVQNEIKNLEAAIRGVQRQSQLFIEPNRVFSDNYDRFVRPIRQQRFRCNKLKNVGSEVDVGSSIAQFASDDQSSAISVDPDQLNAYLTKLYGSDAVIEQQQQDNDAEVADLKQDRRKRFSSQINPIDVFSSSWSNDFGLPYNNLYLLAGREDLYLRDYLCQAAKQQTYRGYIQGIDRNNIIVAGPNGQTYVVQIGACTNFDTLRSGRNRPFIGDDVFFRARNEPSIDKNFFKASHVTCY